MSAGMALAVTAITLQIAGLMVTFSRRDARYTALAIAGDVLMGVANLLWHVPLLAVVFFVLAALTAWLWWLWWRRKKRRNALALLGAKARAARDALVRKAREAAQPRPVLRPVPQAR